MLNGILSVSKSSINCLLGSKAPHPCNAVTIVVGGAQEALDAQPDVMRLKLKGRYGFVKMALRNGAALVPVIGFGENQLWKGFRLEKGSFLRGERALKRLFHCQCSVLTRWLNYH